MGKLLEQTPEQLAEQNITFYSGRHYWKTLMSSAELGDVEEYFMGHKVSTDVAAIYNHRDKQGQKRILAKAKEALAVLDRQLFKA
jgi:integrase